MIGQYAGPRKQDWATPQKFFDELDAEFHFTLDPCALPETAKCRRFFTPEQDGLAQDWSDEVVFMNPPYGRDTAKWMQKALDASRRGATVVCLVVSRTDMAWWHDIAMQGEIRFIRNRLYFEQDGVGRRAPFASAVVVFHARPLD